MTKQGRFSHSSGDPSTDLQSDEILNLSQDEIFHLLQTSRRREVIHYLLNNEGPVKMGDIAEHIAAKENETTIPQLTSTQRQRVYIPLYQTHLPKLDKKGIIEYNKPRGIVRSGDRFELIRSYLPVTGRSDENKQTKSKSDPALSERVLPTYHSVALSTSIALMGATIAGLLTVSGVTLATIITILFALATVATILSDASSLNDADSAVQFA